VDREILVRCVRECFACAAICTCCADASLGEDELAELIPVVRSSLDCAEACVDTGWLVAGQVTVDVDLICAAVEFCAEACRVCAEECERHAARYEQCRRCAEACQRCRLACERLLLSLTGWMNEEPPAPDGHR
jgi:hypothetical protein